MFQEVEGDKRVLPRVLEFLAEEVVDSSDDAVEVPAASGRV
jgi:hypothetical protein